MVKTPIAAVAAVLAALVFGGGLHIARAEHGLGDVFYPPELVQRFGAEAGVGADVLERMKRDIFAARTQMVDAEAKVKKVHLEIESLVMDDATPIDQVLAKVDALGAAETEMKKLHVGLLLRIRRALSTEQRQKLDG